jgi:hypothetical protein
MEKDCKESARINCEKEGVWKAIKKKNGEKGTGGV